MMLKKKVSGLLQFVQDHFCFMCIYVCACMRMYVHWCVAIFSKSWTHIRYIQIHTSTYTYAFDTCTIHTYTDNYIHCKNINPHISGPSKRHFIPPLARYIECLATGPSVSQSVSPSDDRPQPCLRRWRPGAGGSRASTASEKKRPCQ